MAIPQSTLHQYASTYQMRAGGLVSQAKTLGKQTAFLCHSHQDASLAKGVQGFLKANGWEVYIDWEDDTMPEPPNADTARRIKERIQSLGWFLFLATERSMASRWCPWELGFADGAKAHDSILILPTTDGRQSYGNEYLAIYRYIESAQQGGWGAFYANKSGVVLGSLHR